MKSSTAIATIGAFSSCEPNLQNAAKFHLTSAANNADQEITACFCLLNIACMFSGEKNSVTGTV